MKIKFIHKILLSLFIGLLAVAQTTAQDAVFLIGSTHSASFALNAGNTCEWNVYKVNAWTDQKDAVLADNNGLDDNDDFLFVGGVNNTASINTTWRNPGKYYLIVEEYNGGSGGCSARKSFAIEVVANASLAFSALTSNVCSDVGTSFSASLTVDTGIINSSKFYPITVKYRLVGDTEDRVVTVSDSKLFTINLGIINALIESNHIITISSAKDRYGGDLNIITDGGENIHTRRMYALPEIENITY